MRQGQQNRRGRGRNNNNNNNHNNRKNQNPLTRSFESAGPDIKIRGNPSHIAEKYVSLARDALSSGDPVLAENYLQHAEHYNRIILTYREQQMSQQGGEPMQGGQARTHGLNTFDGDGEDAGDDESDEMSPVAQAAVHIPGDGPQPAIGGGRDGGGGYTNTRSEHHRGDNRQQHQTRQQHQHGRGDRNNAGNGQGSDYNGNRRRERFQDGNGNRDSNRDRRDQPRFGERGAEQPAARAPVPELPDDQSNEQPAFLRRPIRRPRRSTEEGDDNSTRVTSVTASDDQD